MAKAAIVAASLTAASAHAVPVSFVNEDFEAGTLTGWSTVGTVFATPSTSVTTFDSTTYTISAEDTTMAQIEAAGASIGTIESTLGIASGTLTALNTNPNGGSLTNGAALYQSFTAGAGDTLDFAWNYVARDYVPFNDPSFALLIGAGGTTVEVLASIHGLGAAVGTSGSSGWQTYSKTIGTAGTYTLAFVTTNDKDTILPSVLFVDAGEGSCDPDCPVVPVPAPGTLGLIALGLLGVTRRRWLSIR